MADVQDVLVELLYTFAAEAGRRGCTLAPGTAPALRRLFTDTVERALTANVAVWDNAEASRYVHKQVARIARQAARVAALSAANEITAPIFWQAAQEEITKQQLICARLSDARLPWATISGTFCFALRWPEEPR